MSDYYYIDVTLEFPEEKNYDVSLEYFKKNIIRAVTQVFGEIGASETVDILKYDQKNKSAILKVRSSFYKKLHSALTLRHTYEDLTVCCYRVNKVSPLLLALNCDSRNFVH